MRVLFFGMRCSFSPPVLRALVAAGHEIVAVITPWLARRPALSWNRPPQTPLLPLATSAIDLDGVAFRTGIPVGRLGDPRSPDATATLAELHPDMIVVACFPRLIPRSLVTIAPYGGVNIHPSRLPQLRGPEPVFHTLHQGITTSALTLHLLSDRFDAGDVLAQRDVALPDGARIDDLEQQMARVGGELLVSTLPLIAAGEITPIRQAEADATFAPFPTEADFLIPIDWAARRVFNFIRGVAPRRYPLRIVHASGALIPARDAIAWTTETFASPPGDDEQDVAFRDGLVRILS